MPASSKLVWQTKRASGSYRTVALSDHSPGLEDTLPTDRGDLLQGEDHPSVPGSAAEGAPLISHEGIEVTNPTKAPRTGRVESPRFDLRLSIRLPLDGFTLSLTLSTESCFNFPSRYLFAIGLVVIFSLRWSLPPALGCTFKQPDSRERAIPHNPPFSFVLRERWSQEKSSASATRA